jgi:hypothetical protein
MPRVFAAELVPGELVLHLAAPCGLPAPWAGDEMGTRWHVGTDIPVEGLGPDTVRAEAPYPLLAAVGETDSGAAWLLNFEEAGAWSITGDRERGRDLVRHVLAQFAVNPWSRRVRADCVGIGEEAAGMDERITFFPAGEPASRAVAEVLAAAGITLERAIEYRTDTATARTGAVDEDTWPARMVFVDAGAGEPEGFGRLVELVCGGVGRVAAAVVVAGDRPGTPGAVLRVTASGRLEYAGLDLAAAGLPAAEALGVSLVYAQAETAADVPVPGNETGADGYADSSGALLPEHTRPRDTPGTPGGEALVSLLEEPDDTYTGAAPVTGDDLEALAPKVPASVRAGVEARDPGLDADLADWFSPACNRPRLSLLGPVTARAHGKALTKRKPYFTELLTYLALHRARGATRGELCEAFGVGDNKLRDYTGTVRDWLGVNPGTGEPHLPHASKAPAAKTRGMNVYQVGDGLLVDLDLFTRLRERGQARGGDEGLADLVRALELVGDGPPFSELRDTGWAWLASEPNRVDLMAPGWIADVALVVATHALATGDLNRARFAAHVASTADPGGEPTRVLMAMVIKAEGDSLEASRIIRDEVCDRTDGDDPPEELSDRTKVLLRTHSLLAS